jgi:hypothetical protein
MAKRRIRLIGAAALAFLVAPMQGNGQQPRSSSPIPEEAYVAVALPAAEPVYARISGERLKRWVNEIVAISHKSRDDGEKYWGRIAGTKYERMTNDWVEERFKEFGLEQIRRQDFELPPQWFPVEWDLSVSAGGTPRTFATVRPALQAPGTPDAGITAEAVWVGLGSAADFAGRDVRAKIVFIQDVPSAAGNHSADWNGASRRAQERGAAGIVLVYGMTGNMTAWERLGRDVTLPGFVMGYEDGIVVRELLGEGKPVTVRMRSVVRRVSDLKSASVWGVLPGATSEDIIVMAHQDGYFDAALDNASGMAVMMGLAEHFSKVPRDQRRRSIVFVGTAGHHSGSPNAVWLHNNRATALANTALMINCEHASSTQTYMFRDQTLQANALSALRWWINGSQKLSDLVFRSYKTFGIATFPDMMQGAGEMGAAKLDAPSIQVLRSPELKHTDADTAEWVPAKGLEAVTRSYAKIIDEVNKLDRRELLAAQKTDR